MSEGQDASGDEQADADETGIRSGKGSGLFSRIFL
jgi:hypothetical protein